MRAGGDRSMVEEAGADSRAGRPCKAWVRWFPLKMCLPIAARRGSSKVGGLGKMSGGFLCPDPGLLLGLGQPPPFIDGETEVPTWEVAYPALAVSYEQRQGMQPFLLTPSP